MDQPIDYNMERSYADVQPVMYQNEDVSELRSVQQHTRHRSATEVPLYVNPDTLETIRRDQARLRQAYTMAQGQVQLPFYGDATFVHNYAVNQADLVTHLISGLPFQTGYINYVPPSRLLPEAPPFVPAGQRDLEKQDTNVSTPPVTGRDSFIDSDSM